MKKPLIIILAVILTLSLAACSKGEKPEPSASPSASASPNLAVKGQALTDEAVVIIADGAPVTFSELVAHIKPYAESVIASNVTDSWSAAAADDFTYGEYVLNLAYDSVLNRYAVEHGAALLGLSLTPDEETDVKGTVLKASSAYETYDAFLAELAENGFTEDSYISSLMSSRLSGKCFEALYGVNGASLSDEDLAEYTSGSGYIMAKTILLHTCSYDDDGVAVPFSEDDKAAVYSKLSEILDELDKTDKSALDAKFTELMNENSEDAGLEDSPDGYLFQKGDMTDTFYNACAELEAGEYSRIIDTGEGYQIVYRIPVNYDAVPESAFSGVAYYGKEACSLRAITASTLYEKTVYDWMSDLDVQFSELLSDFDLNPLFPITGEA